MLSILYNFRIRKTLRLLLASSDGILYMYAVNLDEGGDCSLIKQFQVAQFNDNAQLEGEDHVDQGDYQAMNT